jgi:HK97 family phage major capsid protein
MSELRELTQKREQLITEGVDLDMAMGESPTLDQRQRMRSIESELGQLSTTIADLSADDEARANVRAAREQQESQREATRAPLYSAGEGETPSEDDELQFTPGETFVRSQAYTGWVNQFPSGAPSAPMTTSSAPVAVRSMAPVMGLVNPTAKMRSLLTSNSASAGKLVLSMRRGLIEPGLVRPLTIRQLLTVLPVTTDTIEYVKEASRVSAAANVAEATALTGTSGTKPEGGLTFSVVTDTVKTIAEWVPATKRILQDAPQLQAYIDEYLTYDLALQLENQVVSGNGSGENFTGILNVSGTTTQGAVANENNFDLIRRAKTKVRLQGRTVPTAVVMNPNDAQNMDIAKSGSAAAPYMYWGAGPFGSGNGPSFLWGLPIIESEAVSAGTAIVGDFSRAVLYDRESTTISVGTVNDDFIRNIVRVLAEMRAGFGVIRPLGFCIVTLS